MLIISVRDNKNDILKRKVKAKNKQTNKKKKKQSQKRTRADRSDTERVRAK